MKKLVVHFKKEKFDVYVGRPTMWGNPFSHKENTQARYKVGSVAEAIQSYEKWIQTQPELMAALHTLKGKVLGCWCAPGPCHGDVLARLANG